MSNCTYVVGVGMTKFEKPGRREWDYPDMARRRARRRSRTPAIAYDDDRAGLRRLLLRRLHRGPARASTSSASPASRSSTSTTTARPGRPRCSWPGRRSRAAWPTACSRSASRRWRRARSGVKYTDRTNPMDKHVAGHDRAARAPSRARPRRRCSATPAASTWSATAPTAEQFAKIGEKNHRHSVNNPYSQFQRRVHAGRDPRSAKVIHEPLTKLQCSPDLRRRGRRGDRLRALRRRARPRGPRGRDRRPGHGHRLRAAPSRTRAASRSSATT